MFWGHRGLFNPAARNDATVFLRVGHLCWIAQYNTRTGLHGLSALFQRGINTTHPMGALAHYEVALLHPEHHVFYTNWSAAEITHGCVFKCLSREYLQAAQLHGLSASVANASQGDDRQYRRQRSASSFGETNRRSLRSQARRLFHFSDSWSTPAICWNFFITTICYISIASVLWQQTPATFERHRDKEEPIVYIELGTAAILFTEVLMKFVAATSWSVFLKDFWAWVSIASMAPTFWYIVSHSVYFEYITIRALTLVRVLLSLPVTRGGLMACIATMKQSSRLLYMLLFFIGLALLINSSVIYYLERGSFSDDLKIFTQRDGFECNVVYSFGTPQEATDVVNGAIRLLSAREDYPPCQVVQQLNATAVELVCAAGLNLNETCKPIRQASTLYSIAEAMWLTVASLTTVGFGDVVPVTPWGRFFTALVMYMGIVVVALPITVISSHFEANYRRYKLA